MNVSDLFDPTTELEALDTLTDEEFLLAALCLKPSDDLEQTARDADMLAAMLVRIKSPGRVAAFARAALNTVSVQAFVRAISATTDPAVRDLGEVRHTQHGHVRKVLHATNGVDALIAIAAVKVDSKEVTGRSVDMYLGMVLEEAVPLLSDVELLAALASTTSSTMLADKVCSRLIELGAISTLSRLVDTFVFTGTTKDRARRAIAK